MRLRWGNIVALLLAAGAATLVVRSVPEIDLLLKRTDGLWRHDPAQRGFLVLILAIIGIVLAIRIIRGQRDGTGRSGGA